MSSPNQPSSPIISFLFTVHEIEVNGEAEQIYHNSHWCPPTEASRIEASPPKTVYRWCDGSISKHSRYLNCLAQLTTFKTNSVFWCDKIIRFMTAPGDASIDDVKSNDPPLHVWRELQFCRDDHDHGLSRLADAGEQSLFGTGPVWINHLGLDSYDDPSEDAPTASGLGGELPMVIAILAFSCKASKLEKVLITDKAWQKGWWKGHKEKSGRIKQRGLVVNIYLDPDNRSGSTPAALAYLEWGYGSILVW